MAISPNPDEAAARAIGRACLCLHVRRAARAVARRYDDALRPLGITNGQFSVLAALSRGRPVGITALADELGMDRTTLTANLKPLRRRGLVEVGGDAADRRARPLALTAAGKAALAEALPAWERAQAGLGGAMADADLDRLRRELLAMAG